MVPFKALQGKSHRPTLKKKTFIFNQLNRFLFYMLSAGSELHHGGAPAGQQKTDAGTCTGSTKGQACDNKALPFTKHCFQRIL